MSTSNGVIWDIIWAEWRNSSKKEQFIYNEILGQQAKKLRMNIMGKFFMEFKPSPLGSCRYNWNPVSDVRNKDDKKLK